MKGSDRHCRPSEKTLPMLGWQLFILNIPVPFGDTPKRGPTLRRPIEVIVFIEKGRKPNNFLEKLSAAY